MCVIVVFYKTLLGYPIVLGVNRDEYYERETERPHRWPTNPKIVAGRDLRAGGTWLGVNARRLVVGITNRRRELPPEVSRRSRGLICLDALRCSTASGVEEMLARTDLDHYNGFNLFYGDAVSAYVTHWSGQAHTVQLEPGQHVITNNLDVNAAENGRIRAALDILARRIPTDVRQAVETLQEICRTRGNAPNPLDCLCVDTASYGTVSSTILAVPDKGRAWIYLHSEGNPSRTPYEDLSHLFPLHSGEGEVGASPRMTRPS